jgi:hypothetical protein
MKNSGIKFGLMGLVVLGLVQLTACNRGSGKNPAGVINRAGTYILTPSVAGSQGNLILTVALTPDGNGHLVTFTLADAKSNTVLASGDAGSNGSRWFFYWSASGDLWVHSSDIGSYVWQKQNDGPYKRRLVEADMKIPTPVFNAMPSSLQKRLKTSNGGPE